MPQRKKSGEPRQITKYEISYKSKKQKGIYYVNYSKKAQALKMARDLRKRFKEASWKVRKIKRNAWVKKTSK